MGQYQRDTPDDETRGLQYPRFRNLSRFGRTPLAPRARRVMPFPSSEAPRRFDVGAAQRDVLPVPGLLLHQGGARRAGRVYPLELDDASPDRPLPRGVRRIRSREPNHPCVWSDRCPGDALDGRRPSAGTARRGTGPEWAPIPASIEAEPALAVDQGLAAWSDRRESGCSGTDLMRWLVSDATSRSQGGQGGRSRASPPKRARGWGQDAP